MTYEILQEPTWGWAERGGDSRGVAEQLPSGVRPWSENEFISLGIMITRT